MKIAVISDIHSNQFYFEKCLGYIKTKNVDRIISLGDNIGYFKFNNKIFDLITENNIYSLLGNHEAMLLFGKNINTTNREIYRIDEILNNIKKENLKQLYNNLPYYELKVDGVNILFVHGTPWDPLNGYFYPDSDITLFKELEYDIVFMGHTHRPFIKSINKKIIINAGSCGLPRDQGNMPSFGILDTENLNVDIYRLDLKICELLSFQDDLHDSIIKCLERSINKSEIIGKIIGE